MYPVGKNPQMGIRCKYSLVQFYIDYTQFASNYQHWNPSRLGAHHASSTVATASANQPLVSLRPENDPLIRSFLSVGHQSVCRSAIRQPTTSHWCWCGCYGGKSQYEGNRRKQWTSVPGYGR